MKKCINEFAMVKTESDYVLAAQFEDGSVEVSYERHRVAPGKVEVVQHRNRDRSGRCYTTRKVICSNIVYC